MGNSIKKVNVSMLLSSDMKRCYIMIKEITCQDIIMNS